MPEATLDPTDYTFRPADPAAARTLTPAQVESYNAEGYLGRIAVSHEADVEARRAYFDDLVARMLAMDDGRDTYGLLGHQTRCAGLFDIVSDPRILDVVEDLLGPDFVCWSSHLFAKPAGDERSVPPHQDATYWPLYPSSSLTVWLAIDDSTVDNGCLHVVPGSHRHGGLPWADFDGPVVAASRAYALHQSIADVDRYGAQTPVALRAGEISIHCDLTIHGSRPNTSNRRRAGLAIRYARTDVQPTDQAWGRHAILVRGTDVHRHWTHNPRPDAEDVESWRAYNVRQAMKARGRR